MKCVVVTKLVLKIILAPVFHGPLSSLEQWTDRIILALGLAPGPGLCPGVVLGLALV